MTRAVVPPSRAERTGADIDRLLRAMAENNGHVQPDTLRVLLGGDDERFGDAWRSMQRLGHIAAQNGLWSLAPAGWARLFEEEGGWSTVVASQSGAAYAQPRVWSDLLNESELLRDDIGRQAADWRELYARTMPARHELVRARHDAKVMAAAEARRRLLEHQKQVLHEFLSPGALWHDWKIGEERDAHAPNLLAIYPPTFAGASGDGVHIRLDIDFDARRMWLQASSGGPMEYLESRWTNAKVRAVLLWVLMPALDPSIELPSVEDGSASGGR